MNNSELNELLKRASVPERSEDYWADFPRQVRLRLRRYRQPALPRPVSRLLPRLAVGMSVAVCCLVAGFLFGRWRGGVEASNQLLQSPKFLRETLSLFPNRVQAVIQDDQGVRLVLSDQADVPVSSPLWIKVCDGQRCLALVTFSGQEIQVAGQRVTVLANSHGDVLLVGDHFAWPTTEWTSAKASLKIEAKNLGPLAM
jgi:hypothetical protein